MKTILIVTLGTRDLTINTEIEGVTIQNRNKLLLINQVAGGKYLFDNFEKYKNNIDFPIINPAINWTISNYSIIDKLIIVCTDQSSNPDIDARFKSNDTIEIANLLKKKLVNSLANKVKEVKLLPITNGLIYYDVMYDFFEEKFASNLFNFAVGDNVVLCAQSGIDAINTTLLFKCIEKYSGTIQLNKPENSHLAFPLNFPKKFVKNIAKQQIIHDLQNYNYSAITNITFSEAVTTLANYSFSRISFDFENAQLQINKLMEIDGKNRPFYTQLANSLNFDKEGFFERQKEAYLAAKVKLHQRAYSDFLVQIFTIAENILKPQVEDILEGEIIFEPRTSHKLWNELITKNIELFNYLSKRKINGDNLKFDHPNRVAYKAIVDFHYVTNSIETKELDILFNNLEELTKLRNRVAHDLTKVNETDINSCLEKVNSNIENFIIIADKHFKISNFDVYDQINKKILELLTSE